MKFEIVDSNKIAGAKLELGPKALELIRVALVNSYNTLDEETKQLMKLLNDLRTQGRI